MCDPMWHVSSRSGVAILRTAIHLLLSYLLTYLLVGYTGVVAYSKAAEAGESYSDTMRKALDRVTCDKLRDRSNNCSDNRTCIGQRLLIGRLSIYLAELKKR